jgi:hypothetical protein
MDAQTRTCRQTQIHIRQRDTQTDGYISDTDGYAYRQTDTCLTDGYVGRHRRIHIRHRRTRRHRRIHIRHRRTCRHSRIHRQEGDLLSHLNFFQNKESRLKTGFNVFTTVAIDPVRLLGWGIG